MKKPALVFAGALLVVALGVQLRPRPMDAGQVHSQLGLLATTADKWQAPPLALGATEALAANVADVLRYDDVLFREFRTARGTFSVYAAYWRPGKMPTQLVASHTPDRCWTEAGWHCVAETHGQRLHWGGIRLRAGEERLFEGAPKVSQHVVYWHLVGDALYDYGNRFNNIPSVWRWCRDAMRQVFLSPPEQYFIRTSSDVPFERLNDEPAFQAVVAALGKLGLAER